MKKQWFALVFAFLTTLAWAGLDANTATSTQLQGIKGVGTTTALAIVEARKSRPFSDWNDLIERVKGVGQGKAVHLSAQGLNVNGKSFSAPKDDKSKKSGRADKAKMPMADSDKPKHSNTKKSKDPQPKS